MSVHCRESDTLAQNGLQSTKFLIPVPHYNFCIVHWFVADLFYPQSILAIYERPLINVVQYVWCEVGSACLRIGLFLYRDLVLFLIFGNLILTAIITCMVLPRLSSRR